MQEKIEEIRRSEKTILLVLNALGTVKQFCSRSLLMNYGQMVAMEDTVEEYGKRINES